MKEFLASPIRVFDALNWILLVGGMTAFAFFVRIPDCPGIQWLLFAVWTMLTALYAFVLRPQCFRGDE